MKKTTVFTLQEQDVTAKKVTTHAQHRIIYFLHNLHKYLMAANVGEQTVTSRSQN